MPTYSIGLDYGTSSVRALLVDIGTGEEIATTTFDFPHGKDGVILSSADPNFARQHPADYAAGAAQTLTALLDIAKRTHNITPEQIIAIGVDATASTPIPLDSDAKPLALDKRFAENPNAMAWLWKDHTAHEEAAEITALAKKIRPHFLAKCGGTYSSEWFWSKILHCVKIDPEVASTAETWVEQSDFIPALLTGAVGGGVKEIQRNICAAGHKAMAHDSWNGYPDEEFLAQLHPALAALRKNLPNRFRTIADPAGTLSPEWAARTGLLPTTVIATGAIDAHLGALGAGIQPGTLVKIIGTSTCDLMTAPLSQNLPDIPGLCGIVPGSILPDSHGLEAGQSAVGDIFNWFTSTLAPSGQTHESLSQQAAQLAPGQSGLIALDWLNGNRTVLIDQRLTGLIMGLTLHTTPAEIYRALIEATAFGARIIMERFEEYGIPVARVINAGGIAAKNPLAMQLYADIMNRPIQIAKSSQTCALGAAIAGAVAAKKSNPAGRGHDDFSAAVRAMTQTPTLTFTPNPRAVIIYEQLYKIYTQLHDAFGIPKTSVPLADIMKQLLNIRDAGLASRQ